MEQGEEQKNKLHEWRRVAHEEVNCVGSRGQQEEEKEEEEEVRAECNQDWRRAHKTTFRGKNLTMV